MESDRRSVGEGFPLGDRHLQPTPCVCVLGPQQTASQPQAPLVPVPAPHRTVATSTSAATHTHTHTGAGVIRSGLCFMHECMLPVGTIAQCERLSHPCPSVGRCDCKTHCSNELQPGPQLINTVSTLLWQCRKMTHIPAASMVCSTKRLSERPKTYRQSSRSGDGAAHPTAGTKRACGATV